MNEIDKLAWICIKDKKILVARSKGKNIYYIPGGKREPGESDQAALIREIKEELSVDIHPATIQHAGTFIDKAHDKSKDVSVKMTCFTADFSNDIKPDAEIEEIAWLAYKDKQQCSPVTQIIMDKLKKDELID
jgi:8-oxo-dGTP diphosphatase